MVAVTSASTSPRSPVRANDCHAPEVIFAVLPRNVATSQKLPNHSTVVGTARATSPVSSAASFVSSTVSRFGRHSSRFIMPPVFHSAPTNEAPTTNPTSARIAASGSSVSPKFSRKSKVDGRNHCVSIASLGGGWMDAQSCGKSSAWAVPAAFALSHSARYCALWRTSRCHCCSAARSALASAAASIFSLVKKTPITTMASTSRPSRLIQRVKRRFASRRSSVR